METQTNTNGNVITVNGQKPMLETVSIRARLLGAPDNNSTNNNQS